MPDIFQLIEKFGIKGGLGRGYRPVHKVAFAEEPFSLTSFLRLLARGWMLLGRWWKIVPYHQLTIFSGKKCFFDKRKVI